MRIWAERVAVVTGANRGIGRAVALALAHDGFHVVVTARDATTLDGTVGIVEAAGGRATAVACDVRAEESVGGLARAAEELGPVHTVVANAGVTGPTALLHDIEPAEWRDCLMTNVDGVFLTFRAFAPRLMDRGAGALIAVSSMTGKRPLHGRAPYAASKMAIIGMVRTLALELGPHGVRANSVCPGAVAGERVDTLVRRAAATNRTSEQDARAAFASVSPMGRFVDAEEVARACAFLASDAAAAITGEDLNVTAGAVMY